MALNVNLKRIKIMLQKIVQNSNQLINSQCNEQDSLLCQLVKLKGRKRHFSFYQPAQKKGSIFQEPDFMHRMTFQSFRKTHRASGPSSTFRKRTKSQQAYINDEKFRTQKSINFRKPQIQTLEIKNSCKDNRESKTIHSRRNNEWSKSNHTQKVYHQRVFSRKDKFIKENEIIQEPGLVNLCFYRNTLEQIESLRTARLSSRKKNSPKRQQKQNSTRNKIKFTKYKGMADQNPECRPWSPKNDSDLLESGEFQFFKSVFVKNDIFPIYFLDDENDQQNKNKCGLDKFIKPKNSKMKTFSKTFNFPLSDKTIQSKELMQTMQEIAQRQQEYMAEKLLREAQIQNRIKQMEETFQEKALKKQQKIRLKLEKSQKNRVEFLEKIVKRCKEKERVLNQKIKTTNTKRKQSLRQAWKAATQFNEKILQGRLLRHKSQHKDQKNLPQTSEQNLNKSLLIPDYANEENKSFVGVQQNGASTSTHRKNIESGLGNRSLLRDNGLFHSTFNIEKKLQKLSKPVTIEIQSKQSTYEDNPENPYNQKLRQTLIRHQQAMMDEENKKIQEYGQRLEKINLSRRKKDEIHKSRLKKSAISTEHDDNDEDQRKRKEEKLNKKHNRRLKSESHSCQRVKRASDWSELNQQRRQQLINSHIEMGNQYLSENKIRYLKEIMTKNIAYDALEKKLYEQRIRHV